MPSTAGFGAAATSHPQRSSSRFWCRRSRRPGRPRRSTPVGDGPELVPQDGIGIPDHLARLWTPHRMAYVTGGSGADRTADPAPDGATECPFCRIPSLSDEDGLIVARGELVYAVLNLFPY